jgi:hypothetical protein
MAASQNAALGSRPGFFQISLGFKQLARGLHALVAMAVACGQRCLRRQPSSE